MIAWLINLDFAASAGAATDPYGDADVEITLVATADLEISAAGSVTLAIE